MFYKTALLGAVSLSLALPMMAQESEETTLDTVIVEGSRLDQAATEIGSSVTIITAEDIEELGFDFALDAVASAPGVTINSNGAFGGSAFAEYGSFNTFRGGASVENGSDIGDFRLALVTTTTDGISKADENNGNTEDDFFSLDIPESASANVTTATSEASSEDVEAICWRLSGLAGSGRVDLPPASLLLHARPGPEQERHSRGAGPSDLHPAGQ